MNDKKITYKEVIRGYFYEFSRGFRTERFVMITLICIGTIFINWFDPSGELAIPKHLIFSLVPLLFTVFSGVCQTLSLPTMIYLIPYSQKLREEYMQKMLYVRIILPLAFAILWDCVAFLFHATTIYAVILQLTYILFFTYFHGTLNDGAVLAGEKKAAFGGIKDFTALPQVLCYVMLPAAVVICAGEISTVEFRIVYAVMFCIFAPGVYIVGKRWHLIRANFADYEMSTKMEERPCRY